MPNPAKPLQLLVMGKKAHMTKEQKKQREASEITMGNHSFKPSRILQTNPIAYDKWLEITDMYVEFGITFVSSSDSDIIEQYAFAYSEWYELIEHRASIKIITPPREDKLQEVAEKLENIFGTSEIAEVVSKINILVTVQGDLLLDKSINAKVELMLKLSDRLFLNPLAKIRSIPRRETKKADPNQDLFGD